MEIKFKVAAEEFNAALGVVSIVKPQPTPQGGGGYLFVVQGTTCRVYSKNGGHEARASFEIQDVEGEGPFMYPADHVGALSYVQGLIAFTATSDGDSFKVRYTHGGSGVSERVSFDPRTMHNFEKDVEIAKAATPREFDIKILQTALGMAGAFMAKVSDKVVDDANKTIKIFGASEDAKLAKANGYMFSSNGKEAFYFQSPAFQDRDLSAPGAHLPLIEAFLAKSLGVVKVYPTAKNTYLINTKGDVFGWPQHEAEYKAFTYLAKNDEVFVRISAKSMLYQLQYMRAELAKERGKMRLNFKPSDKTFWFEATEEGNKFKSLPVEAQMSESKVTDDVVANVNVDHMIDLFENIKGDLVEFRVRILAADAKRPKPVFMFRTIDEFSLNGEGTMMGVTQGADGTVSVPDGFHLCKVTRFASGID